VRFLVDQDVYELTTRLLEQLGHDVLRAREAGLSRSSDSALLRFARDDRRVVLTRDKGFGQLVFGIKESHAGVVLLRLEPVTLRVVHEEIRRFLHEHASDDLRDAFVVIEPGRHRIRKRGTP
jgi:predicted nuclease of predicted toxin-antitoxin system